MDFKLLIRRFLAFVIDWNIMFGVAMALMFYGPGSNPEFLLYPSIKMFTSAGYLLGLAWLPLYCLFKDCLFGRRSLGKLIFGLSIQNSETGRTASFGSLILRNITYVMVQIEGVIVFVNNGKRLGDTIAKTQVVRRNKNT
ncbi:MAG: RDD family protein [Clostridia bacterium]|nr:RDD family protein [Clostridia bacterium]